jgi:hypothetical protein
MTIKPGTVRNCQQAATLGRNRREYRTRPPAGTQGNDPGALDKAGGCIPAGLRITERRGRVPVADWQGADDDSRRRQEPADGDW